MKQFEMLFGITAVIAVVLGVAFFSIGVTTEKTTQEITTEQTAPAMETYTFSTGTEGEAESASTETAEIDKEREIEYLYVKVQTIQAALNDLESRYRSGEDVSDELGGVKADINDMEEHLYDVFDLLDQTETDQFQEELDNARERVTNLEHEY